MDGMDINRYFEYGVYAYGYDTKKRISETINPTILNYYVYSAKVDEDGIMKIYVVEEETIDDIIEEDSYYEEEELPDLEVQKEETGKVYVCSPLRGNVPKNLENAKDYCLRVLFETEKMPIAPHLYFTNFLDDTSEVERALGIDFALRLLSECDEIWVFNENGISEGMQREIDLATKLNIPIRYIGEDV